MLMLQVLSEQQAAERAQHEAAFNQARQQLVLRWQAQLSTLQEQLMLNQQQMMTRHEQETANLLVRHVHIPHQLTLLQRT